MKKWMVFVAVVLLHHCLQVGLLHAAAPEEHALTFHIRISAFLPGSQENPSTNHTMLVVNMTLSGGGHGGFAGGGRGGSRGGFWSGAFSRGGFWGVNRARGGFRKSGNETDADGQHSGSNGLFASVKLIVTLFTIVGVLTII